MKTIHRAAFVILVLMSALAAFGAEQRPFETFQYPKLADLTLPQITEFTLANGLKVMLVEDHKLPLVKGNLMLRAGSVFDPADKAGLANLTFEVLRTGGTAKKNGDEIDAFLESRSAYIEAGSDNESGNVSFNCLTQNFAEVLPLYAEFVMTPGFREDKLTLAREQAKSGISRRNDEPQSIAFREFSRILYGKDHPYARLTEYATVDVITRDDLVQFHKKYFFPENGILAVWGDIDAAKVKADILKLFGTWARTKQKPPVFPAIPAAITPGVYFAQKDDVNQSYIVLGHWGIRMDNPDYCALEIMNRIFGTGGLSSRLFAKIRTEKGLTYGISGGVEAEFSHTGNTSIYTFTKSPTTAEAVTSTIAEVKTLMEKGVTQAELDREKSSYLNTFVFKFDSVDKIIRRLQTTTFYGYPKDFILKTKAGIEKVTVADVNRVAAKYWHPDQFVVFVVGNDKDIQPPMSQVGKVQPWDIAIPKPRGAEVPKATNADLDQGLVLMKEVAAKAGGAKVADVKAAKTTAKMTTVMPQGEFAMDLVAWTVYPDKVRAEINTPMGKIIQIYDGSTAWMETPQGKVDQPAKDMADDIKRSYVSILKAVGQAGVTFQLLPAEGDLHLVAVKGLGEDFILAVAKDNTIAQIRYQGKTPNGVGNIVEIYSSYKPVDGILYPFVVEAQVDGKSFQKLTASEVVFNPTVDPAAFKETPKP